MSFTKKLAGVLGSVSALALSGAGVLTARAESLPADPAHQAAAPQPTGTGAPAVAPSALAPELTFLHGIGERPEDGCAALREAVKSVGWTHCPRGNLSFGAGYTWGGDAKALVGRLVIEEASHESSPGAAVLPRPRVLVAFSQGGYVAPTIVVARPGWYSGILVVGATATYSRATLERVGVRRIGFAAGRWDPTYEAMKKNASTLARAGFEARFFDLGAVGHTYIPKDASDLVPIVAWLAQSPSSAR